MQKNLKHLQKAKKTSTKNHDRNTHRQPQSQITPGDQIWLCGKHPSFSALQKKRRKIFEILVTKNSSSELEKFLSENSLSHLTPLIKMVEGHKIEAAIGSDHLHQGIAIRCAKLQTQNQFQLLEDLHELEGGKLPTLLLLDQLSDPQNIGAIIRSAASFGVKKIIFSEHSAPKENATIAKTAAGTLELVDLVIVTNFNNLIEKLKKIGYWCIGLDGSAKMSLTEVAAQDYKNIALIIGSEGVGMRDLVKKNCDILTKIKIDKDVESLNASVAAAIALYELSKNHEIKI